MRVSCKRRSQLPRSPRSVGYEIPGVVHSNRTCIGKQLRIGPETPSLGGSGCLPKDRRARNGIVEWNVSCAPWRQPKSWLRATPVVLQWPWRVDCRPHRCTGGRVYGPACEDQSRVVGVDQTEFSAGCFPSRCKPNSHVVWHKDTTFHSNTFVQYRGDRKKSRRRPLSLSRGRENPLRSPDEDENLYGSAMT